MMCPALCSMFELAVTDRIKEYVFSREQFTNTVLAATTISSSALYQHQFHKGFWPLSQEKVKKCLYLGSELLPASFSFSYPNWLRMLSTIIGARDWAGLVNKAFVPNTIEERGELKEGKEENHGMYCKTQRFKRNTASLHIYNMLGITDWLEMC